MKLRLSLLATLCCTSLLSQTAFAETYAFSQINNLSYRLIDLDLQDGITPELTFNNSPIGNSYLMLNDIEASDGSQVESVSLANLATYGNTLRNSGAYASGLFAGGQFGALTQSAYSTKGIAFTANSMFDTFTLTPQTQLVILGEMRATMRMDTHYQGSTQIQNLAQIHFRDGAGETDWLQRNNQLNEVASSFHSDEQFQLTLRNESTEMRLGGFSTDSSAVATVSPVPEPETYAMLGLGLFGLAAIARRKKAAEQAAEQAAKQ